MKFNIIGKTFEAPVIEAKNADEAIVQFAASMDSDMNLYFKAIPVKECEPLMRITDIEWDLDDIEDEAEAYSINDNLPKSEDIREFIEEDQIADYLSNEYGYCVKSFTLEKNVTTQFEKLKKALFEAGRDDIENFLGYELDALDDKDAIDKLMDAAIMLMPDDTFNSYYMDYVIGNEVNIAEEHGHM